MKKVFTIFILFVCLFALAGCTENEPLIVFSSTPFSKAHGYTPSTTYKNGDKIYYLIYNPKGFKTRLLKVQVFRKETDKASDFWGYEYLYNKTLELTDRKFYTDYFIINKSGSYMFQIFEFVNTLSPIVKGVVKVVD